MAVYVDDRPYASQSPAESSLRELALEVSAGAGSPQGRAVVEIWCDGRQMLGAELETALSSPVSAFSRIDLQTGGLQELARATLRESVESLDRAMASRDKMVALLGQGQLAPAMELLKDLLEAWRQSQEAAQMAASACDLNLDELNSGSIAISEVMESLKEQLGALRSAIQAGDLVLVSDLVQYDLFQPVMDWRKLLDSLDTQLQA